jgi:holo-[acyl-carrier protein] synthase
VDGYGGVIVGLGHDLQLVSELSERRDLLEQDVFFRTTELEAFRRGRDSILGLAAAFSAKESFFKAVPVQCGWVWSDLEVTRTAGGRPALVYHGDLHGIMRSRGWTARLSVSHSGQYVSTVVIVHA